MQMQVVPRLGQQLDQLDRDFHLATPAAFDRGDTATVRISAKRAESFWWGNGHLQAG